MRIETVDRGSKEKLYVQVYAIFSKKIESGEWQDGLQIPSEDELCRMYDVSKVTVREAIHELVREGYLKRQQGKGTFVTYAIPHAGILMKVRLSGNDLFGEEVTVSKEIVERGVRESSEETKKLLMTDENIYYILSRMIVNDEPFAEEFFIPMYILPDIHSEKISDKSLYDLIEEKGTKKISKISQTAEIAELKERTARVIKSREGVSALLFTRIMISSDGSPIAFSRLIGGGRKHTLQMEFQRLK
ncbi:MAG: GntR family transcriptional regulator [Thermodesulfovibrionales bacterium]|nr:GntR family transcriptional regulator [Thermodesulfovibrionales bacterium]